MSPPQQIYLFISSTVTRTFATCDTISWLVYLRRLPFWCIKEMMNIIEKTSSGFFKKNRSWRTWVSLEHWTTHS